MSRACRRACLALTATLAGCTAVAVPVEQTFRLRLPPAALLPAVEQPAALALRVADLRLAAHLSLEAPMLAEGPVRLQPYALRRWAGPLDGMVTDLFVATLRRSGAFAEVKTAGDSGTEDLVLSGTIVDFHEEVGEPAMAVVTVHLALHGSPDARLVWSRELGARAPLGTGADAGPLALSQATLEVAREFVAAAADLGAAAAPR